MRDEKERGLNDEQLERQSLQVLQWARLEERQFSEVKGTKSPVEDTLSPRYCSDIQVDIERAVG